MLVFFLIASELKGGGRGEIYEGLESGVTCDYISIIAGEIVRVNNCVGTFTGNVVHVSL